MTRQNEQVASSPFQTVGDYGSVQNTSAQGTGNTQMAPRDKGRAAGDVQGVGSKGNRRPIQIDATTGQALADSDQSALQGAAGSRWSNVNLKRGAMADVLQGASDAQYAGIPGLIENARTVEDGVQIGSHIGHSMRNDHVLSRLFGNPGREDCCGDSAAV
jgi:hypothetical protein